MADTTLIGIVLAIVFGEGPVLFYALSAPTSTPREVAALIVATALGVAYLFLQGVSVLDPNGVGIIAYLGASTVGIALVSGGAKIGSLLPHAPATGGSGPPPA